MWETIRSDPRFEIVVDALSSPATWLAAALFVLAVWLIPRRIARRAARAERAARRRFAELIGDHLARARAALGDTDLAEPPVSASYDAEPHPPSWSPELVQAIETIDAALALCAAAAPGMTGRALEQVLRDLLDAQSFTRSFLRDVDARRYGAARRRLGEGLLALEDLERALRRR